MFLIFQEMKRKIAIYIVYLICTMMGCMFISSCNQKKHKVQPQENLFYLPSGKLIEKVSLEGHDYYSSYYNLIHSEACPCHIIRDTIIINK